MTAIPTIKIVESYEKILKNKKMRNEKNIPPFLLANLDIEYLYHGSTRLFDTPNTYDFRGCITQKIPLFYATKIFNSGYIYKYKLNKVIDNCLIITDSKSTVDDAIQFLQNSDVIQQYPMITKRENYLRRNSSDGAETIVLLGMFVKAVYYPNAENQVICFMKNIDKDLFTIDTITPIQKI